MKQAQIVSDALKSPDGYVIMAVSFMYGIVKFRNEDHREPWSEVDRRMPMTSISQVAGRKTTYTYPDGSKLEVVNEPDSHILSTARVKP